MHRLRDPIRALTSAAWLTLSLVANAATAQESSRGGLVVIPAETYSATGARTALDAIRRTPGFSLIEPDPDVRGYAGALGNLLIDGARPAGKTEEIDDLLGRIPMSAIERIELIRSAAGGVDLAGYSVVANVVRRQGAAFTAGGAVTLGAVGSTDGWLAGTAEIEYARRGPGQSLELAVSDTPSIDDDSGSGSVETLDGLGERGESRQYSRVLRTRSEAAASWRRPAFGGALTLAGSARRQRQEDDTDLWPVTPGGDDKTVTEVEDDRTIEATAGYERVFSALRLNTLFSHRQGALNLVEEAREDGGIERFLEKTETAETLAHADVGYTQSAALTLTASLDAARNTLTGVASLEADGLSFELPGSTVAIEERRIEGALGAAWGVSPALTLEAALRVEASEIVQGGDAPLDRTFLYAKPRVSARWDATARDQVTVVMSREVGQLDFSDFVVSVSLENGAVSAGARDLRPDQTWRVAATWDHAFETGAALSMTWTHDAITDVMDRVLVTSGPAVFDAPGNIGPGRRDAFALDLQTPLEVVGLPGARLRATMTWRTSRVTDPTTGETRGISEEPPVEGEIAFTQDLPAHRLQWGVTVDDIARRESEYRFDEVIETREEPSWTVFAERRLGQRWLLRIEAENLFGRDVRETRFRYGGPRPKYPLEDVEARIREVPGRLDISLRRTLGG